MSVEGWIAMAILVLMIFALSKDFLRPGLVLGSALTLYITLGIVSYSDALSGFSNKAMITVGILFLVSEGVRQSGSLNFLANKMLPQKAWPIPRLQVWLMMPVVAISAFLNNTAVVIIFAPMVKKWAEKINLPASKFLIPLSYATILGGVCTLMGTSTNLIVDGMMREQGFLGLGLFELSQVGLFLVIAGVLYMAVFGNILLPGKRILRIHEPRESKEYCFEAIVVPEGVLVGTVIENKQNEKIKGFYIVSVRIGDKEVRLNQPYTIQGGEHLTLAGRSDSLSELLLVKGLEFPFQSFVPRYFDKETIQQVEVVLAPRFQGIGMALKDYNFVEHYGAVVTAIHRNGENIVSRLEDVILKEGDNLVLVTDDHFLKNWSKSRVFYMTSYVGKYAPPFSLKKVLASLALVTIMVLGVLLSDVLPSRPDGNKVDMFFMSAIAAIVMVWMKLVPARAYTKAISWDVLITIACSFGIAKALHNSGIADYIASSVLTMLTSDSGEVNPIYALAAIYLLTSVFTELVTNNAAAALSFPIALAVASQLGIDPRPFFIAICVSASASFTTPIGYQTNLIVQGIGNYKFVDFVKIGLPLNLLCFILSIYLIPIFWSF